MSGRWLVTYTIKTVPFARLNEPGGYVDHTHRFDNEAEARDFAKGLRRDVIPGVSLNVLQTVWFWAVAEIAFGSDD
jgi:hypothetical protein